MFCRKSQTLLDLDKQFIMNITTKVAFNTVFTECLLQPSFARGHKNNKNHSGT